MSNRIKYLSVCGGTGTLAYAFLKSFGGQNLEIVGNIDSDSQKATKSGNSCIEIFNKIFLTNIKAQDVNEVDIKLVPAADIMEFSPPKNTFIHKKGKRDLDGTGWETIQKVFCNDVVGLTNRIIRSDYVYSYLKLVEAKKPYISIIDTTDTSDVLDRFIKNHEKLGYTALRHYFNAKDYGVPQDRTRTCVILFKDNVIDYSSFEFPKASTTFRNFKDCLLPLELVPDDLWFSKTDLEKELRYLTTKWNNKQKASKKTKDHKTKLNGFIIGQEETMTENLLKRLEFLVDFNGGGAGRIFDIDNLPEYAPVITASFDKEVGSGYPYYLKYGNRIRHLAISELGRLMGFASGYCDFLQNLNLTRIQQISVLGNSGIGNYYFSLAENIFNLPFIQHQIVVNRHR